MSREIKFRAWDKKFKEMIFDIQTPNGPPQPYFFGYYLDNKGFDIMQFTGLKDRNDKEIYEGDILYWEDFADDEYWAKYKVEIPNIFYTLEHLSDFKTEEDVEIIGNIYDPELIKDE